MKVEFERGYLIPAINSSINYVDCAINLAKSLKQWHPQTKVCLLTDEPCDHSVFDLVKLLPFEKSLYKFGNDWQVFSASPFRQTIKLEADMFVAGPVDHWWTLLEKRDIVISKGCRDFYNQPAESRFYRKIFDANNLPDVYNAITYWRLSKTAQDFFNLTRKIFENWDSYKKILKFADDEPTTDVVYAIAAQIIGPENVTLPDGIGPQIVHMKKHIIKTQTDDWTKELVYEFIDPGLRIQTIAQHGFVHYHIKEWLNGEPQRKT